MKLLTATDELVLKVSGASLYSAGIWDLETLQERFVGESPFDVASTQMTFPLETIRRLITLPTNKEKPRCVTLRPTFLSDLHVLEAAAADTVDLYFGKTGEGLFFACEGTETTWLGRLMPIVKESEAREDAKSRQTELPGEIALPSRLSSDRQEALMSTKMSSDRGKGTTR